MTDPTPEFAAETVTAETHKSVTDELNAAREQLALLKAKTEIYDSNKRDSIKTMKGDVSEFIGQVIGRDEFSPYKNELMPMQRWVDTVDTSDSLDTNLSMSRFLHCASATLKRTRDEASALGEKNTALAAAFKELETTKSDLAAKATRIVELEGLVNERTEAATKLQDELARAGVLREKIDFSSKAARENVEPTKETEKLTTIVSNASAMPQIGDALLGFLSGGTNGNGRIMQSQTSHHLLGNSGNGGSAGDIYAAALARQ